MPHVSDVAATPHDRHDPMLVAALAAGDLTGADRDQAIALTRTCTECAELHDDLVAIARVTATVPPPVPRAGRDFRIAPEQAARLRRAGLRRFFPTRSPVPSFGRPLGIALATFGIAGLLIGSLPLGLGGSAASAPFGASAGAAASAGSDIQSIGGNDAAPAVSAAAPAPVASAAAAASEPAASAAASGPADSLSGLGRTGAPETAESPFRSLSSALPDQVGVAGGPSTSNPADGSGEQQSSEQASSPSSGPSPWIVLSLIAIAVGVVLVVAARRSDRSGV